MNQHLFHTLHDLYRVIALESDMRKILDAIARDAAENNQVIVNLPCEAFIHQGILTNPPYATLEIVTQKGIVTEYDSATGYCNVEINGRKINAFNINSVSFIQP